MITATRLIYEFDRKYDRFKSQYKKNLDLVSKLNLLNEAQTIVFKAKAKVAEGNTKLRNELRFLEEKEVSLKLDHKGKYSIAEFPEDYYMFLRKKVFANKNTCGEKELVVTMFDTNDLNLARKHPFFKSSYEWEHCLADEGRKGLYLFHEGDFEISEVVVDYYRVPKELHAASLKEEKQYVSWDGELITRDQGSELEENLREIVDTAILIARADLGDIQDYKTKLDQIINVEKINQ